MTSSDLHGDDDDQISYLRAESQRGCTDVTTPMGSGTWGFAKNHPLTKLYRRPERIEEWADWRSIQSIVANNLLAPQKSGSYHVALLFYPHRPRATGQSDPIITGCWRPWGRPTRSTLAIAEAKSGTKFDSKASTASASEGKTATVTSNGRHSQRPLHHDELQ